jgi:L-threonylcarbamoyladenylate synthase
MIAPEELARAAEMIRAGRLVAFPTETVYGLGANALDAEAVDRIFRAKGRPATSPLIVHVASMEMACTVAAEWTKTAATLTARFWPGPLTLVVPKTAAVPDRVTAGLPTVGVRMPRHPVALALLEAAGVPIAAPSANRFTQLSPTTAAHVRDSLGDAVDLILDGGPSDVGIESTVLSVAATPPVLLRPGMVSRKEIEALIGRVDTPGQIDGPHPSPGMHERHYSPRTPLKIEHSPRGRVAWVWWSSPAAGVRSVPMPADADSYAAKLYDILHLLDRERWDCIVVEPVPDGPEWDAVRDRLLRAATEAGRAGDRVI